MEHSRISKRALSICGFSLLFAYILSFLFEGRVLYAVLEAGQIDVNKYVIATIVAHFCGQFSCGFFCN